MTLDGEPLTINALTAALDRQRQQHPRLGVSIRGDAEGPFQHVASVLMRAVAPQGSTTWRLR